MKSNKASQFALFSAPLLLLAIAAFAGEKSVEHSRKSAPPKKTVAVAVAPKVARISYREEIEPILKSNCGGCHTSAKKTSGFSVEVSTELLAGGTKFGTKEIVKGKSAESMILSYLRGTVKPQMPLGGKPLAEADIRKIAAWIDQGAKIDPPKLGYPYLKPVEPKLPKVKQTAWATTPIDRFALAKMEEAGLKPSAPASKTTLIRRVTFDLIGLPPTPLEIDAFVKDATPDAYAKVVDRLLADSRYGERWARHWLDLVRFAETHGFENDGARNRMWRYRDYVIRAFNSDMPYDRFLKEQIAGDELYPDDGDALVATAYLRLPAFDELSREPDQRWQDTLNDVTDTTASAMLGLTVGCARCHNHKYDKISQADYYRLQAFFTTTKWTERKIPGDSHDSAEELKRVHDADTKVANLRETLKTTTDKEAKEKLEQQINRLDDSVDAIRPEASAITDEDKQPKKTFLLQRGDLHSPGQEVKAGFVASLTGGEEAPASYTPVDRTGTTGLRSSLANWIGSPDNPMTARVIVNRLWQHHFGRGIVGTPSDFGINGEGATHKELLDYLALQFMKEGWSIKKMQREMLLTNLYQQTTADNPQSAKIDPLNKLLSRMNRLRLEGEPIRDSILALGNRLNPEMYGPSIYPKVSDEVLSSGSTHKWGNSPEGQQRRRTIYVFQRRSLILPIVEVFDGGDLVNACPRRNNTTIAPQALALFNSDFTQEEAPHIAERIIKDAGDKQEAQVERAFRVILGKAVTEKRKALALEFLAKQKALFVSEKRSNPDLKALADLCHVLVNSNEFLYLD